PISAEGKHVVIIGGGDTGADCLGTAIRQGAKSITQLEILDTPPDERPGNQPWPTYPMIYRVSSAHEEGGERMYAVSTSEFHGDDDGNVTSLTLSQVKFEGRQMIPVEGTERTLPAELVLLAMGFVGPERDGVVGQLGVALDERGNVARDKNYATDVDGVFVCGDAGRGQSLIVWAIAEGRACAAGVDAFLSGSTKLPRPIPPTARQMMV
ncbi:MAG TPA: FAD-dependent oxidoreductase, partial [Propionibacteriaceae bacterium]